MTGKAKPMEEVTLEDMQINPIGIFALDEEGNEGQDETWLKPLLHTTDVTQDLVESYILLKVKNSDVYSSACLDIKRMKLNDIAFWVDNEWQSLKDLYLYEFPITLISIPSIKGESSVKFVLNKP